MTKKEIESEFAELLENLEGCTAFGFNQEDVEKAWSLLRKAMNFRFVDRSFKNKGNDWWEGDFAFDEKEMQRMVDEGNRISVSFSGGSYFTIYVEPKLNETAEQTVRRAFEKARGMDRDYDIDGRVSISDGDVYSGEIEGSEF